MRRLEELAIVETPLDQWGWSVDVDAEGRMIIESDVQIIEGPRETDDYHLCGVYHKAGVPFAVTEVGYTPYEGMEVYEAYTRKFSDVCCEVMRPGRGLVIAGGFCTYLPGIVGGIQRALGPGKKLGIVYLDGHADIETPEMTRSHIVAGMPVAAMLGLGLQGWRDAAGMTNIIPSEQFLLTDYHARSPQDDHNIRRAGLDIVDEEGFKDPKCWDAHVEELAQKVDAIFLHIDVDIMASRYVPAFKFPLPENGQKPESVMSNVKKVMETGKAAAVSVMDVCFSPNAEGSEITYLNAMRVLGSCLESWRTVPEF